MGPFARKPPDPPAAQAEDTDAAAEQLWAYRRDRFLALGYDSADALELADSRADWHRVANLLSRGVSHLLAKRIEL